MVAERQMKTGHYLLLLLCGILFTGYSCKDKSGTMADKREKTKDQQQEAPVPLSKQPAETEETGPIKSKGCLKGIPQRVIDASVLPGAEFKQVDLMGYEKIELPTGDHLLIINWGCQSYNLTFRFETSRFGTDTSKIRQWYSILTQLLYVIEPAIDSPVKIQQGIDGIHQYLKQDTVPVAYNVPLILNNDSIFSDMVFERVKILGDTMVRIDATFSVTAL
jgi:hypothetical protein